MAVENKDYTLDKEKFIKDFKKDFLAGGAAGLATSAATQGLDNSTVGLQAGSKAAVKEVKPISKQLKIFGLRASKGIVAGAVGYPVFTGVSTYLDLKDKRAMNEQAKLNKVAMAGFSTAMEKDAAFAALARIGAKMLPALKNVGTGSSNFVKGFTGLGKGNGFKAAIKNPLQNKATIGGTASGIGAPFLVGGAKKTTLEQTTKGVF